jgi:miniconductance mechanosensitive channel
MAEELDGAVAGWVDRIHNQFYNLGLNETVADIVFLAVMTVGILVLCVLAFFAARWILSAALGYVAGKTDTRWDDILVESRLFKRLAFLAPALVVYLFADAFPNAAEGIQRVILTYMVVVAVLAANALLNAFNAIYRTFEIARSRPIKGFVQVVKIIIFIIAVILILSAVMNRSPWVFLTGMGAMMAVLLIIFKDTLLGLVASFQITAADMVREGDWIEMPKFGADGDVIDVTLHTVKVRNWDKTITTIPTYALVSDSFRNWRGMEESGGRRIKRAVNIDMNTIRICDDEMLDRFEKMRLIGDLVKTRRKEVADFNRETGADDSVLVNGRRLTNVGTFRAYVAAYLKSHPKIHQDMTFLVRQLAPGEHGLPIEIYVFSRDQAWARYEEIQADIFDHILAVVPEFGLRVFQSPSGSDFAGLGQGN